MLEIPGLAVDLGSPIASLQVRLSRFPRRAAEINQKRASHVIL
jgi:hypothetical protein